MTTLTTSEIQEIYRFVASRGIEQIDIQHEIVDHVASAIEEKRRQHPEQPLDEAIREVHRSFGVLGFSKISDAYAERVMRENWRAFWQQFRAFFTTPKIAIPLLAGVAAWQVTKLPGWAPQIVILLWLVVPLLLFFRGAWQRRKSEVRYSKYMVSNHAATFLMYLSNAFNAYNLLVVNNFEFGVMTEWQQVIIPLMLALHTVMALIVLEIARQGRRQAEHLHRLYAVS
jgi:hypothetical protein